MASTDGMSPHELAALLSFHADAGVEWLVEDAPVDRIADFDRTKGSGRDGSPLAMQRLQDKPENIAGPPAGDVSNLPAGRAAPGAGTGSPAMVVPDKQAKGDARTAAISAETLPALKAAMEAFSGCNLKTSARTTVFATGGDASGVMIIGPMPTGEDDRSGIAFSGRQGQMLEKMLAAIGLTRDLVWMTHVIPWRPPGNRPPSVLETDICRPFIERQIVLAQPKTILILGNFAGRFFFGGTDMIHHMRGTWRQLSLEGRAIPTLLTLHPQDLMSAPASKKLAWQDLLALRAGNHR